MNWRCPKCRVNFVIEDKLSMDPGLCPVCRRDNMIRQIEQSLADSNRSLANIRENIKTQASEVVHQSMKIVDMRRRISELEQSGDFLSGGMSGNEE